MIVVFFLNTGNFEVGVHIADVSYFVEEGNALDDIASQRATSVYLVQKVHYTSLALRFVLFFFFFFPNISKLVRVLLMHR